MNLSMRVYSISFCYMIGQTWRNRRRQANSKYENDKYPHPKHQAVESNGKVGSIINETDMKS